MLVEILKNPEGTIIGVHKWRFLAVKSSRTSLLVDKPPGRQSISVDVNDTSPCTNFKKDNREVVDPVTTCKMFLFFLL